jgi:hypothetical protein
MFSPLVAQQLRGGEQLRFVNAQQLPAELEKVARMSRLVLTCFTGSTNTVKNLMATTSSSGSHAKGGSRGKPDDFRYSLLE